MYRQYAWNNFGHTQAGTGITTKLQTSPKTQEFLYNSQSHIKGTKLAPKGPFENEKHAPRETIYAWKRSYLHGYMLGTNADTRMASQEAVQDQEKQKCCIFLCFCDCFFFQSQKVEISIIGMFRRSVRVPRGPERSTNRLWWVYIVNTKCQHAQYTSHWILMTPYFRV